MGLVISSPSRGSVRPSQTPANTPQQVQQVAEPAIPGAVPELTADEAEELNRVALDEAIVESVKQASTETRGGFGVFPTSIGSSNGEEEFFSPFYNAIFWSEQEANDRAIAQALGQELLDDPYSNNQAGNDNLTTRDEELAKSLQV
mmetsp:Transcript_31877/g.75731  ORF Transcript_31877/g.75731 Transcript_31877/m.75731 type:complete len:146 (+) Transcript_31877:139-576(+)